MQYFRIAGFSPKSKRAVLVLVGSETPDLARDVATVDLGLTQLHVETVCFATDASTIHRYANTIFDPTLQTPQSSPPLAVLPVSPAEPHSTPLGYSNTPPAPPTTYRLIFCTYLLVIITLITFIALLAEMRDINIPLAFFTLIGGFSLAAALSSLRHISRALLSQPKQ